MIENIFLGMLKFVAIVFVAFMLYSFFIWMPVALYAEQECLKAGYPKSAVDVSLNRYCKNMDAAVTIKVQKQ